MKYLLLVLFMMFGNCVFSQSYNGNYYSFPYYKSALVSLIVKDSVIRIYEVEKCIDDIVFQSNNDTLWFKSYKRVLNCDCDTSNDLPQYALYKNGFILIPFASSFRMNNKIVPTHILVKKRDFITDLRMRLLFCRLDTRKRLNILNKSAVLKAKVISRYFRMDSSIIYKGRIRMKDM